MFQESWILARAKLAIHSMESLRSGRYMLHIGYRGICSTLEVSKEFSFRMDTWVLEVSISSCDSSSISLDMHTDGR